MSRTLAGNTADYRRAWAAKAGLRFYYEQEIFDRILARLIPGRTLELGAGPGFFAAYRPGAVTLDIAAEGSATLCADAHRLPLAGGVFANVVGVDVIHHLARPEEALTEIARVLMPGGRLILVEPWAGPLGGVFYRYFHHEDCKTVADPWQAAFPSGKMAMEGNAMIPRLLFAADAGEAHRRIGLIPATPEFFGLASYAATGGFQTLGASRRTIKWLCRAEARLPAFVRRFAGLRALFVLERAR